MGTACPHHLRQVLPLLLRSALLLLPLFYCSWLLGVWKLNRTLTQSLSVKIWRETDVIFWYDPSSSRDSGITTTGNTIAGSSLRASSPMSLGSAATFSLSKTETHDNALGGNQCFLLNSVAWLNSTKHGNSNDNNGKDEHPFLIMALNSVLSHTELPPTGNSLRTESASLRAILRQSLCYHQSPFLDLPPSYSHDGRDISFVMTDHDASANQALQRRRRHKDLLRLWTTRLIFWVIYEHQHQGAIPEARARSSFPCKHGDKMTSPELGGDASVGLFDFECPNAKFLVISFTKSGLGANLRLGAVPALQAGIASNRVVMFVNDAKQGPAFLQEPWPLASCSHRRDSQCVFRAATPCILSDEELDAAYTLNRGEMRKLFRIGTLPLERINDRALILHLNFRPQRQPENLRVSLHERAVALVEHIIHASDMDVPPSILYQAAAAILEEESHVLPPNTYNYYGSNSTIFMSLLLYAMRLNPQSNTYVDDVIERVLPRGENREPENAMGLPIRGTDVSAYMLQTSSLSAVLFPQTC